LPVFVKEKEKVSKYFSVKYLDFFIFCSFHEVGTKDLPAMIDYILKYTDQKDLYYIGHSMGTTSLFAFLSTKPEYNIKVKMVICLSPVVFWIEVSPEVYAFAEAWPTIKVKSKIGDYLLQAVMFKIQSKQIK
jgi:pimeloyl-ACP methyl ester carboxylesterase